MKLFIYLLLCSLFCNLSYAGITLGTGVTSATSGRVSPFLHGGYDDTNFALTLTSVGVKNDYYYHSAYNFVLVAQKDFPKYLWGNLRGGIGIGSHYAIRELKDGTNSNIKKSDFALGPAIRITWEFLPYTYIGLEAIFGIRNANIIVLSTQNIRSLILGVRF